MKPNLSKKRKKMDVKDKVLSKFTSGRTKAIKKRKRTLLLEYKHMNKSNKFIDRRIGEKDRGMTAEDRLMARFVAQRVKSHNKKQMFNLGNDEEVLTHQGRTLQDLEKFDNPQSDSEDDEDGKLEADFVKKAHFGGGLFTKASGDKSSHQSTIDQLIAESKKRKAERQQTKEETLNLTDKLDEDLKELLPVFSNSRKDDTSELTKVKHDPQSYDVLVRELKFERVGKPSDRLKSEDQIASEEKQKLDKLEKERLERMKRSQEFNDEDDDEPATKKHQSADDLDDGFDLDVFEDDDGSAEENESDVDEDQDETISNESDGECQSVQNQPKKHDCDSLKSLLEQRDCVSVKRLLTGASKDNLVSSFNVLLEHIDALFRNSITTESWDFASKLCPILFEITQKCGDETAEAMFTVLKKKQQHFSENVKSGVTPDTLIFLKMVPLLFPTSDYYHPVATPSIVLISHVLSHNTCKTLNCIAKGLFLATLMLEYITLSNRYCPEVMNFLKNVLYIAIPNFEDTCPPVHVQNKVLTLNACHREERIPEQKLRLSYSLISNDVPENDEFKLPIIYTTLKILAAYSNHYNTFSSAHAIWSPISGLLDKLPMDKYPESFATEIQNLKDKINLIFSRPLQYLVAEKKRPKALRLYEPNIRPVIEGRSFRTVSQAKLEKEKLVHQYKKEMKGALREIRKDKNFLARVKMSEQAKKDAERKEKVKRILGWGQNQQSEFKMMERKNRYKR